MEFDEEMSLVDFRDMLINTLEIVDIKLNEVNQTQWFWLDWKMLQHSRMQDVSKWN